MALTVTAGERVRELFALAVGWVAGRLNESERRDDWLRITPPLREDEGWESVRLAGENATTALAALDAALRRAVGGARDWLRGTGPDQSVRGLGIIRWPLPGATTLLGQEPPTPHPNPQYS